MRHGKKFNHLGRKTAHRKAMLANMACSLIEHKRIKTTVAKAKALRKYVEPLITKAKNAAHPDVSVADATHVRRVVFSYLRNKHTIKELFSDVAAKVADRPGGYTRILKIGNRLGDNAEMALIELVDYNELAPGKAAKDDKKRRKRRGKKKAKAVEAVEEVNEVVEETTEAVEEVAEEVVETVEEVAEEATDAIEDAAKDA